MAIAADHFLRQSLGELDTECAVDFCLKSLGVGVTLLLSGIPQFVWPYFAGLAILAIGLPVVIRSGRGADPASRLVKFGPLLFAVAMAVFGADHFTALRFVAAGVPSWIPWHMFWAIFVGIALTAGALSLAANTLTRLSAACFSIMIFLFVLLIHAHNLIASHFQKTFIILFFRDLALSAGAGAFAAAVYEGSHRPRARGLVAGARFAFAATLVLFGIDHFLNSGFAPGIPQENPSFFVSMPSWLPLHSVWIFLTGVILVACGLSIASGIRAKGAATAVGFWVLVITFFVYVPLTISKASDVADGLNYLAIHFALAGAALMLADALPADIPQPVNVAVSET